jgi:hypothetical protein
MQSDKTHAFVLIVRKRPNPEARGEKSPRCAGRGPQRWADRRGGRRLAKIGYQTVNPPGTASSEQTAVL